MNAKLLLTLVLIALLQTTVLAQDQAPVDNSKTWQGSLEETQEALKADPDNLTLKQQLLTGCVMLNRWDEALSVYRSIRDRLGQREKENCIATLLFFRAKAIEDVTVSYDADGSGGTVQVNAMYMKTSGLQDFPQDVRDKLVQHFLKGWQLFQKGAFREGEAEFEEANAIKETDTGYLYLGLLHHNLGQSERAVQCLEKCLSLAKKGTLTAHFYTTLAYAYRNGGDLEKAVRVLENYSSDAPEDPVTLYNLANLYREMGSEKGFIRTCEKIKSLDPVIFALVEEDYYDLAGKL